MRSARATRGGFTIIEVMISMVVMTMGLFGILAIHTASIKGNQASQRLDRARTYAQEIMEELRGKDVATIEAEQGALATKTTDGVAYQRSYSVANVSGQDNLVLVTVLVSYGTDGDETDRHEVKLQIMRTRQEQL